MIFTRRFGALRAGTDPHTQYSPIASEALGPTKQHKRPRASAPGRGGADSAVSRVGRPSPDPLNGAVEPARTFTGIYRDGWMLVTAVTATVGVWTAFQTWPMVAVLGAFACAALVGGSLAEAVRVHSRTRLRLTIDGGLAGVAATAAAGLIALFGAPGLLVIALLAAACPDLWAAMRGLARSPIPGPGGRSLQELPPETSPATVATAHNDEPWLTPQMPSEPRLLDDDALCLAWRRSSVYLEHPHSPVTHLRVAQQRQLYLDEFERRNRSDLCAWFASGAHAASDPTGYSVPDRRREA
jgi:hypothetical protein